MSIDPPVAVKALWWQHAIDQPIGGRGNGYNRLFHNLSICHSISMSNHATLINRKAVRRHRDRSSRIRTEHDFLITEAAVRLVERLQDIKRHFPLALELGCRRGQV